MKRSNVFKLRTNQLTIIIKAFYNNDKNKYDYGSGYTIKVKMDGKTDKHNVYDDEQVIEILYQYNIDVSIIKLIEPTL